MPTALLATLWESGPGAPTWVLYAALALFLLITALRLRRWLQDLPAPAAARAGGVPVDEWRLRGLGLRPRRVEAELQPGQRCPLCHDEHQPPSEAARCDACGAVLHVPCARDLGRCSSLGCQGDVVRVEAVRARA